MPLARHGRLPRSNRFAFMAKSVGMLLAVVVASSVSVGAVALTQINGSVETVTLPGDTNAAALPPGVGAFDGGFNMLIVGSDECVDTGGCPGRTEKLNDFTMLLHVAANHESAVAVSFPRDLIVRIPACPREDGKDNYAAMSAQQINVTLIYGGLACTVVTVRALTGLSIPYAGIMTFNGVREISTALGAYQSASMPRSRTSIPAWIYPPREPTSFKANRRSSFSAHGTASETQATPAGSAHNRLFSHQWCGKSKTATRSPTCPSCTSWSLPPHKT